MNNGYTDESKNFKEMQIHDSRIVVFNKDDCRDSTSRKVGLDIVYCHYCQDKVKFFNVIVMKYMHIINGEYSFIFLDRESKQCYQSSM